MKQTIEIDVPDGYRVVYDQQNQKLNFVKNIIVPTWNEPQFSRFKDQIDFLTGSCPIGCNDLLLGAFQLYFLRKTYLQEVGYSNWNSKNSEKFWYINRDGIMIDCNYQNIPVHELLRFPTKEIAEEFFKKNEKIVFKFQNGIM